MSAETRWRAALLECRRSPEKCEETLGTLLESLCPEEAGCKKTGSGQDYGWIERLIELGVPDGRSRLILYVISRYLVSVKKLSPEDCERIIEEFIEKSCKNHGNCSKIYKSWVRNVIGKVSRSKWKPWSLERIKREDPQLYEIVASIVGAKQA